VHSLNSLGFELPLGGERELDLKTRNSGWAAAEVEAGLFELILGSGNVKNDRRFPPRKRRPGYIRCDRAGRKGWKLRMTTACVFGGDVILRKLAPNPV
jgi:hypothetical protein